MNINDAFPSQYLKASDLQGRNVTIKMGRVEEEKIGNDKKMVLYFQGKDRGVVLNKTNANNIASIYGGETEDWYGQEIVLYEAMVDYQGKSVPAIRMRAPQRKAAPAPRREMAEAGFDREVDDRDRVEHERPAPRREAPARNEDMNDDIPF
jgi:hypothetical protein